MDTMFQSRKELEYLDLSSFNTSNVTDMGWMFNECRKLKVIKGLNNFNTSQVIKMCSMFQLCNEVEYLDLSILIQQVLLIWKLCLMAGIN